MGDFLLLTGQIMPCMIKGRESGLDVEHTFGARADLCARGDRADLKGLKVPGALIGMTCTFLFGAAAFGFELTICCE
jgi:hypothetical protein